MFIAGVVAVGQTTDHPVNFNTLAEAQQYLNENNLNLPIIENEPPLEPSETFKPYKIVEPAELDFNDLNIILKIAYFIFFIQIIKFVWLVIIFIFKLIGSLLQQEPEVSPQAIVIVFWW
jgi:hypothetical protein